jgi:hypothetical protein
MFWYTERSDKIQVITSKRVLFLFWQYCININTCIIMYYYVVNGVVITDRTEAITYKSSK